MNEEPLDSFHKSNLASILLTNWNIPHSPVGSVGPSVPLNVSPSAMELNRASRYLLPEYHSLSQEQLSSLNKDQTELRYDLMVDLFKSTDSDSANAFTKLFTFGAEMQIWRKGRIKQCTVFLDQHVPTLIWISSLTKAFLFDIAYTTFTRFDAEFQISSPTQHYIILRYFQEEIPFLFESDTEAQRYFDLFVNYRSFNRVKNQYPPYFSKLIKYYTLAQMTSDCKRSKTVGEILKIADNISGSDKREEYLEVVKQLVEGRPKNQDSKQMKLDIQEIVLNDAQVMQFMKIASCNENLKSIFQYYAQVPMKNMLNYTAPLMDLRQFKRFLIEEQHEHLNQIDKIIQKFAECSNPFIVHQDYLSFYQFCSYCCRMDINYLVRQPELNRNLPITDYFIWSSHNTYLSGNQLTSDAKVERYLEDLNDGIKCVEIDVHDDGNTPIVTHALKGIHLNRSVTFEEVIRQIGMYCKKNQNFDPLILSIQNHASEQNRYTMVNILFKYLQRYLFTLEDENVELEAPSSNKPQELGKKHVGANLKCRTLKELRGKVIIKTDSKIESILSQRRRKTNKQKKGIDLEVGRLKQPRYFISRSFTERFREHELMNTRMATRKQKFIQEFPINYYQNLNDQMVRVTGMFKNHQGLTNPNPLCYQCLSITNKSLKKVPLPQSQTYTKRSFVRVYPVATELASGNYNPIHGLQRGAQIIAINTQTKDEFAWLMMSYFTAGKAEEAKSIGYVEKPEHLRSNYANRNEITSTLNGKITPKIAQVKKIQSASELTGVRNTFELIFRPSQEVLLPKRVQLSVLTTNYQIDVKFFGTDLDRQRNRDSKFSFDIHDYNEAFFMFQIGQNLRDCVPVRFLQEGYRVIAGRDARYNDCGVRILVRVKIKSIQI